MFKKKKSNLTDMMCVPMILALRRLRQEDGKLRLACLKNRKQQNTLLFLWLRPRWLILHLSQGNEKVLSIMYYFVFDLCGSQVN
jgi:hypothetical protein